MKRLHLNIIKLSLIVAVATSGYLFYDAKKKESHEKFKGEALSFARDAISQQVVLENRFPEQVKFGDVDLLVDYTIDKKFQNEIEKILKRYPNDYTAVVVLDNETGRILASSGVERDNRKIVYSLPFSSTHPSASLFKIITSAELLDKNKLDPSTKMNFRGRGTTLYKYQLKNKVNRWTRWISFKKAFASSNNVIFGKAAIQKTSPQSMFRKAFDFGFNRQLMKDFNIGPSRFVMPESQYQLAELASGFNKKTTMSPVHAALLSSVVANGGYYRSPRVVDNVKFMNEVLYFPSIEEKVLDDNSVSDLDKMMQLTVSRGTARRISRGRSGRKLKSKLVMGAKTGSITGGIPFGKRDWLTLYARPKKSKNMGISVAVMNINGKKWYHKSTFLMKKILNYYLKSIEDKKLTGEAKDS